MYKDELSFLNRRIFAEGEWDSLVEAPIPPDHQLIQCMFLSEQKGNHYYSLRIYYDDFIPFNPENKVIKSIESRGTIKEAIEKASYYGRVKEIYRQGNTLYSVVIDN